MELKIYDTKQEVADAFSNYLFRLITSRDTSHIALSGGSTPGAVFDSLAKQYADKIDWSAVHFYWGDERCVPPDDLESNYRMTQDHLLSKIAIPSSNIHRIRGENPPAAEASRYAEELEDAVPSTNGLPSFDLLILGMGEDGHTASIFPDQMELWDSDSYCVVASHPESGQQRISLTGRVINNAREVCFLVTGEGKSEKVGEVVHSKGSYREYPASRVSPHSGRLSWFLDAAAAREVAWSK